MESVQPGNAAELADRVDEALQKSESTFRAPRMIDADDTSAVDGEVRRPAIYELKGNTSVSDILQLAGGVTTEADTRRVALVRVNERRTRVVVNVPLDDASGRAVRLIVHKGGMLGFGGETTTLDITAVRGVGAEVITVDAAQ